MYFANKRCWQWPRRSTFPRDFRQIRNNFLASRPVDPVETKQRTFFFPRYRPQLPNDICLTQGWGGIGLETDCLKLSSRVVCRRLSRRHPVRSSLCQQFTLWRGETDWNWQRCSPGGENGFGFLPPHHKRIDLCFHRLFRVPQFSPFTGVYLVPARQRDTCTNLNNFMLPQPFASYTIRTVISNYNWVRTGGNWNSTLL